MEIRCLLCGGNFCWDEGFTYRDVFLVEQPDGNYFLYLKESGKQVSLCWYDMETAWCFFDTEVYTPPAFEIECYKKLLNKGNDMDTKERIAKLEAELAELKKEVGFKPYLAWVSDINENPDSTEKVVEIHREEGDRFYSRWDISWRYATPLTRAEVLAYLPPVKSKYDWDAILKEYPDAQVAARHPDGEIVMGSQSEIKVGSEGFNSVTHDGGFLFVNSKPEWILDKDCDWRDSIEYRRDVV